VPNFAEIAKPLPALTRKDRQFTWGPQQEQAFQSMKDRLCTTPVLAYLRIVRTDHAALTYLQKFADHNRRLLRWSLKLSELDFVVENRAGSKTGHVDALTRHMGAITKPDPVSRESVRQEQRKDAFCRRENPGTYNSKSELFMDSDDVMYRRQQNGKHQLVVPQTLIQDVIRENHDPKYVAHPGIKRTYSLILLNYWWPKMRETIEQYVRRCDPC